VTKKAVPVDDRVNDFLAVLSVDTEDLWIVIHKCLGPSLQEGFDFIENHIGA